MSDTVVTAKFVADTTSLQAGAQRVTTSLRGVDDGIKKSALSMNALKAGLLGAGAAVGAFALKLGVDAVQAAAEEEKAIVKLGTALKNVGQEFRLSEVETFIDDLQRASGVADDDLRPALQSLVTATGDVTQAQDLLNIALDISAQTGRDLTSVSIALAKASNGQFMQINRLTNGAINPAILATKDLSQVTGALDELYGGAAQANAETYAGKISRLKIAYDELIESFGMGLFEGLSDGTDATKDFGDALRSAEPGMREFGKSVGELAKIFSYVSPFFDDVVNTFKFSIPAALGAAAAAFPPLIPVVSFIGTTFMGSKAAVDAYTASADRAANSMSGTVLAALQTTATGIGEVGDSAEEAAEQLAAMKAEMDLFLASTGQISAVDKAAASIDNLGTASVEFGTNLMGQSPKARDFRAEVVSAFEDSAKAAQSLSDDLPTQRAIFTGELIKIVASLRESGVKDKDIEAFLGAMEGLPASVSDIMRSAAKAVGDTDFKTQVEKAFDKSVKAGLPMTADSMERLAQGASKAAKNELGLTLEPELASIIKSGTTALRPTAFLNGQLTGKSIGSGLANGITTSSPIVQAAITRVIAQAKAAADAAAESNSPSRLFAQTGDDMVAGLAMGVTRSTPRGVAAMSAAATSFTRAFMKAFFPKDMGAAETAIANAIAAAEADFADARGRLKEASKAVRESEKALAAARKGADAKEIAKAERDLAKAREDATKAADAVRLNAWVRENEKALGALKRIAAQYDYIVDKMDGVKDAFAAITELLAQPLGTSSDLSQMFKFGTDPRTLARNFTNLADSIREAFAVLTDPRIVGSGAARENQRLMDQTIGQLQAYVTRIMELQNEYSANTEQMRLNEEKWRDAEARLSKALADATRNYDEAISRQKSIRDGFRSFINDIGSLTDGMVTAVKTQTTELANGVRMIVESADTTSAAGAIAANMRARLAEVREFSSNVKTLMERGLDPALIRDFVEAGVASSGATVAALASATDDELRSINETQAELAQHASQFAEQYVPTGDLKAAVDAAQKALNDALATYTAEKARLEAEQARIEADIALLVTQIEALITDMMATLIPATEAAAQASIDAMIAQFQKDFPRLKKELGTLMDALAKSMQRTVTIKVNADTSGITGAGVTARAGFTQGNVVVQTPVSGRSVMVAPNAVSVNISAGAGVDRSSLTAQVKAVVDQSLLELAREIVSA